MVSTNDPDPSSTVQVSSIQEPTVTTQSSVLDDILVYPSVPESKKSTIKGTAALPKHLSGEQFVHYLQEKKVKKENIEQEKVRRKEEQEQKKAEREQQKKKQEEERRRKQVERKRKKWGSREEEKRTCCFSRSWSYYCSRSWSRDHSTQTSGQ